MMKYWKFITSCFSCCKRKTKGKLLSSDVPLNHHTYTVRRISSFGRSPSNDDLVKNVDSKTGNGSTMPIPCNRVTLTVQTVNEDMEDCLDSVPDQLDVKHKKRWKKAISISKVHSILRTTSNKKGEQKEKDNNKDGKQTGDDGNHERTDNTDKNEESDKKNANKEQLKIGSWNKAVSAVQRKKSNCKRSPTISVSSSNNKLYAFYSGSELDVANHSSSLSTTKSSIDLHSMDYLSPCAPRDSTWLKSQSMQDIKSLLVDDTTAENSSEVAKAHGIDITLYQNTPISKSAEAVNKARQALDVLGKEDGLQEMAAGTIFFEVEYDESHRKLTVQIEKVSKLAGRGKTKEIYKFVVKLTILPGEKESFSTKKHNLETRIDEQFIFNVKDIYGKVLRFSVFDAQWQKGKYDAVGHALFYIEDVMQPFSKLHQMKLYKQSVPDINPGALQLAMFFNKEKSTVGITVMQVENVNISTGKCKVFVKVMSFSQGHKVKEKCSTPVSYNSESETVFNYTVSFKVDETGMKHNYIVISLKLRSGSIKQDKTIGRLIIGPYFYAEDNATHTPWGKVIICNEMVSNSFRMYL